MTTTTDSHGRDEATARTYTVDEVRELMIEAAVAWDNSPEGTIEALVDALLHEDEARRRG